VGLAHSGAELALQRAVAVGGLLVRQNALDLRLDVRHGVLSWLKRDVAAACARQSPPRPGPARRARRNRGSQRMMLSAGGLRSQREPTHPLWKNGLFAPPTSGGPAELPRR